MSEAEKLQRSAGNLKRILKNGVSEELREYLSISVFRPDGVKGVGKQPRLIGEAIIGGVKIVITHPPRLLSAFVPEFKICSHQLPVAGVLNNYGTASNFLRVIIKDPEHGGERDNIQVHVPKLGKTIDQSPILFVPDTTSGDVIPVTGYVSGNLEVLCAMGGSSRPSIFQGGDGRIEE